MRTESVIPRLDGTSRDVRVVAQVGVPVRGQLSQLRREEACRVFLSEFSARYGDVFPHAAVFTNTVGKSSSRSSTAALMTAWPSWVTRQRRERGILATKPRTWRRSRG